MASMKKMDSDEEMLMPGGDNAVMSQPYRDDPPLTQQPYAGAAAAAPVGPPAYEGFPQTPYPQGGGVPMAMMGGGVSQGVTNSHTTVIVNQPAPVVPRGPRDWTTGIGSCCDDAGVCLLGMFCPCIQAGQLAVDMGESCCVPCCVPGYLIVLRTKLRTEHKIRGTVMDDCCTVCCCGSCVQCQLARELKYIRLSYGQVNQVQ